MGKPAKKLAKKGISTILPVETIVAKIAGKTFGIAGDLLGGSVGKELNRWEEDIDQVGKVASGEYHREAAEVNDYQEKVEAFGKKVERAARAYSNGYQSVAAYRQNTDELMERLERLIAFDEIFKLALKNRFKDMDSSQAQNNEDPRRVAQYKELQLLVKQYELMVRQLKQMIANLKADFDFVVGLTEGPFLQRIVGSIIMIVGGLSNNLDNVFEGEATTEDWKNIITVVIIVVAIVFTAGTAAAALGALAAGTGTALAVGLAITALVLAVIGAFMTLDGMYANGAATGAIMSSLDFIFNDLLNLDDFVGKDFNKFDKDHEDYQEMVMYTQLAIAVSSLAASWGSSLANAGTKVSTEVVQGSIMKPSTWNVGTASAYGTDVASQQTGMLAAQDAGLVTNTRSLFGGALEIGDTLSQSSVFGIKFTTYSEMYEAFTIASDVKDMIAMNDQYNQLGNKLTKDAEIINVAIVENTIQKTRLHIADSAYFLQDQQEYIDRYIWSMVSESMYVDPYGTTPVANIRFQPDKDTRIMSFGFEDMFDESKQAGSKGYFNNIIYGS